MITMSEEARKELEAYFGDKREPIRIILSAGGCGGPHLQLVLDAAGDEDVVYDVNSFSICMSKELEEMVGGVAIDLTYMGFTLTPEIPLPGGGSCGSCCGSCGSKSEENGEEASN